MIVYADRTEVVDPRRRLRELREEVWGALGELGEGGASVAVHDRVVSLLIGVGEVEAGVVDRLCPEVDGLSPLERAWREVAIMAGHALRCSWRDDLSELRLWLLRLERALRGLESYQFPAEIEIGVHEGYAFYGLYPEMYLEAAAEFVREVGPAGVVCIGVRSIGAGLSAVVAAGVESEGGAVRSYTVRPRGHPFDRQLVCSAELEAEVRGALSELAGAHFVVVDEGPGLSGSSLAAVAEWLSGLGVPDERIALFPSWRTDGSGLLSERARARWPRHRQFVGSFEASLVESGRLGRGLPRGRLVDLSAGRWRGLFYRTEAEYPAVQPQHERRKYLLVPGADAMPDRGLLLKFAGLGRYGRGRAKMAALLAAAGWVPPVVGWSRGFIISEFRAGRPVRAGEVDGPLVVAMARYLAWRAPAFPAERAVPFTALLEMIRINATEGLGEEIAARFEALELFRTRASERGTVAIDGRLFPHEWLRTESGYLKVDGVDHHDDHFFPGCQDIAWDLAGTVVECGLGGDAEKALVERYVALSGDRGVVQVLPFYRVAYLAFRLGYTTVAAEAVGPGAERARLRLAARRYGESLLSWARAA